MIKSFYHDLENNIEYVEIIKKDIDDETDYIIEETQYFENKIKSRKLEIKDSGVLILLSI